MELNSSLNNVGQQIATGNWGLGDLSWIWGEEGGKKYLQQEATSSRVEEVENLEEVKLSSFEVLRIQWFS